MTMMRFARFALSLIIPCALFAVQSRQSADQQASAALGVSTTSAVSPRLAGLLESTPAGARVSVVVTLRQPLDVRRTSGPSRAARSEETVRSLQRRSKEMGRNVAPLLLAGAFRGQVERVTPLWIVNGFGITAAPDLARALASHPAVASVVDDATIVAPAAPAVRAASAAAEQNLSAVHAPDVWALGVLGQGAVVASLDTGVDATHPDLAAQWRGGSNSWYDPNGQHATPADVAGHGTWTMGVMVGGDAGGTAVGIAPGAQWIAAKIFDDGGTTTVSKIHQAFQWVLDPDGDPSTPDAPSVVNNSWSFSATGCDLQFEPDIQALRAAGIVPVFAAGNYGPAASTSVSPANNPGAIAAGATDNTGAIYGGSSRGPTDCGGAPATFPDVVAPGIAINTTDIGAGYYAPTGTSLSAPHVAGAAALLMGAFPWLTVDQVEGALLGSAADLGAPGPDNDFGNGMLDMLAAYQVAAAIPPPVSTATPTAAPTASPGDANCDGTVSMTDALLIARFVVGLVASIPCPQNADVSGDERITMTDSLAIARSVVGLP